jgi:hypothetical protein
MCENKTIAEGSQILYHSAELAGASSEPMPEDSDNNETNSSSKCRSCLASESEDSYQLTYAEWQEQKRNAKRGFDAPLADKQWSEQHMRIAQVLYTARESASQAQKQAHSGQKRECAAAKILASLQLQLFELQELIADARHRTVEISWGLPKVQPVEQQWLKQQVKIVTALAAASASAARAEKFTHASENYARKADRELAALRAQLSEVKQMLAAGTHDSAYEVNLLQFELDKAHKWLLSCSIRQLYAY